MTPPSGRSRWLLPAATLVVGVVAGVGLAASFTALHSNWNQLGWVTPDAKSTAPFWFIDGLVAIVVSAGWTGLVLHGRGNRRWLLLTVAVAALEIAILAFAIVPVAQSGNGGVWATNIGLPALALILLAAPVAALSWRMASKPVDPQGHVAASIALPVAIYLAFTSASNAFGG